MAQARTEFAAALNQIASEKGVDVEVVLDAIRIAALAAFKKDLMLRNEPISEKFEEFTSKVDPVTGEISIFDGTKNITPPGFARIAASIARQVIMQKLHEAEKGAIMTEYEDKVGTIISGSIQRQEGNTFFIDLGRAEGIMPPPEQVHSEYYHVGQRLKFYIKEIREGGRGPEVVLSRSDSELVKGLFIMEVPELQSGSVEIKVIAREGGGRSKVAAQSSQDGVDPVGSLVGQKGVRVQAVMSELGEEKIDIISYSDDPARFIAAALSPAKDIQVRLDEEAKVATVTVPQTQLSLAIGKGGQNVRLAAKLTGWKIDIEGAGEPADADSASVATSAEEAAMVGKPEEQVVSEPEKKEEVSGSTEEVPAETVEEGEVKAEVEATDPAKTPGEAVVEAVEENITQALQEESVGGETQEPDVVEDPKAAADAEADMESADAEEAMADKEADKQSLRSNDLKKAV